LTARSEGFGGRSASWVVGSAGEPTGSARLRAAGLIGIGITLRQAREALGVSYETAERDTHIPRHHLQALEEERFEAFHAPVYVRGFLKSYSQYLRLDSTELLQLLPPERPLEDERLVPLSRLGRPRGPREAAHERRDPAARDAPMLTADMDSPLVGYPANPSVGPAPSAVLPTSQVVPRLDPLGRLGWPESPDEVHAREDLEGQPPARGSFSRKSWEQPLSPRRTRRWNAAPRQRQKSQLLPEDMRALEQRQTLLAFAAAVCGLLILWVVFRAVAGPDITPKLLAEAGPNAVVKLPVASGEPLPHGSMPNLMNGDLASATATLQNFGVVPVVLSESGGDTTGLLVRAQIPDPGTALHSDSTVLIVVGN
jgi:Helix-turn-helix domain/PASTA domain